ncbi:hypothetical protein ACXR2T_09110 [Leucobacter sp. HY1910]
MITKNYATFSTSNAEDQAFQALQDISTITRDMEDVRVVGGLMVNLHTEAFPSSGIIIRHTLDVDTAISVQLASAGTLHERLIEAGYDPESGNRYRVGNNRVIDLLIPSSTGRFTSNTELGGRGFDSVPGLSLALAGNWVTHVLTVTLSDGSELLVEVRTPTVEHALILKAYAANQRGMSKDFVDLYNLLLIADQHDAETIGGWRIGEQGLTGARGDAAQFFKGLQRSPTLRAKVAGTGVSAAMLLQLIDQHVGDPTGTNPRSASDRERPLPRGLLRVKADPQGKDDLGEGFTPHAGNPES